MSATYRYSMLLGIGLALALGALNPLRAAGGADPAMLKRIASSVDDRTGVIAIEASTPVAYVASQPDPNTFVVELRDVVSAGFQNQFAADPRHPISAVQVENGRASDGAVVARVRMTLEQPMRPRVRSARNVIYVEADRPGNRPASGAPPISLGGPAAAIRDVRVLRRGNATAVTLLGTSRLVASSIAEPKTGPRRVVVTLVNTTSAVPNTTPVGQGPVERVRIGIDPVQPLLTMVNVDLSRPAPYRVESSPDGNDLTLVFDEPVADPFSALQSTTASVSREPATASASRESALDTPAPDAAVPPRVVAAPPRVAAAQAPPAAPQTTAAPQPAPQAPAAQAIQPQGPRYTGNPVTLDFQGADLRAVLRTFSEISGLNLVIDPTIQGTVDVALRDVPWDQALDVILRANKLGYVVDGSIVRIAPLTVLADEEAQRRKLSDEQALAGELRVMTRALSYARAEDLRQLLTATVLSQRGSIQFDERTNTIIVNDLPERLERAAALLNNLDRAQPQVEIEARIVTTTREFARNIGVQWGVGARASTALGNTMPLAFPNQGSITGRTGGIQGPPSPDPQTDSAATVVNMGVSPATSGIGLALGAVNGAVNLDVALTALERSGQGRILSTPRVSTQNNIEAEITQGVQIPIQTVANNTVTVTFRDAALTLRVTPQITATNTVIMRISVENASPDFSRAINGIPPIDTQRAITQVLVGDGDTTVIGGIYVSKEQAAQDRTPGLYRIPLLGWLFQRNQLTDDSRELLIFITPRIARL
ncbi:MAG TPA: type IV pilus secretin PilQ [Vicinamibacterales bacterium]|nr:type IV pilus secretin PilQ [Vicinamibacterales bacterium]